MQPAVLQKEVYTEFRQKVQDIIATHITPDVASWRQDGEFPYHLLEVFADNDLLGISQPKEVGGSSKDFWHEVVLAEELARSGATGWVLSYLAHTNMLIPLVRKLGDTTKHRSVLTSAICGKHYLALAATEPGSGSDMVNISTNAEVQDDVYVLNGGKKYITNGSVADYVVVLVKTKKEGGPWSLSLLLVNTSLDGVTQKRLETVGLKTGDTAQIQFSDVEVPRSQLLGKETHGLPYLLGGLQRERLVGAVSVVALADQVLDNTIARLKNTNRFGSSLTNKQVVRHRIAKLRSRLESARQFTYAVCDAYANQENVDQEILMLKVDVYEEVQDIISACAHLYGAESFLENTWISHVWRDAQAFTFAAGTSEVMCDLIAEHMQI